MNYIDITKLMINKRKYKYSIIEKQYYIDNNGNKYNVDGKHVILKPSKREKEVAEMLGNMYGGNIYLIPRVNEPEKIKTPDYIVNGRRFDLKEISGKGKYVIEGNIRKKMKQADNFIIDLTNADIDNSEAERQVESIYRSKRFLWIDEIVFVRERNIVKIFKRKLTANHK